MANHKSKLNNPETTTQAQPEISGDARSAINVAYAIILGLVLVFILAYFGLTRTDIGRRILSRQPVTPTPTEVMPTDEIIPTEETFPSEFLIPSVSPTTTVAPEVTNDQLKTITNRLYLGRTGDYTIYLLNSVKNKDNSSVGQLAYLNVKENDLNRLPGSYTIAPNPVISKQGDYLSISSGTSAKRDETIISLKDEKVATPTFCMIGLPMIWKDYAIYNNCDEVANRPWSSHLAPSIVAKSLKTGTTQTLLTASDTQHFGIKSINSTTLTYYRTSVQKSEDWQTKTNQKTETLTYDLSNIK